MSGFILPRQFRQYRKPDYGNLIVVGDPALALGFREGSGARTFDVSGNNFLGKLTNDVDAANTALNPKWKVGAFGREISFSEINKEYIQTDYPGVLGTDSRACICIMRWLGGDVTSLDGTISNYGSTASDGERWALALNGNGANGNVGAARVSVGGGYNIGTVDVSDEQQHVIGYTFAGSNVTDVKFFADGNNDSISGSQSMAINTQPEWNMTVAKAEIGGGQVLYSNNAIALYIFFDYAPRDEDMLRWTANPLTLFEPQRSWSYINKAGLVAPVISENAPHPAAGINLSLTPATTTEGFLLGYNILLNGTIDANVIASDASGAVSIPVKYGNKTYNVVIRGNSSLDESSDSNQVSATSGKTDSQVKAETLTSFD